MSPVCKVFFETFLCLRRMLRVGDNGWPSGCANKLSEHEEKQIVSKCCSERFRSLSPNEIVAILAEDGIFVASESSMYRVLRKMGLIKHRAESKP